MLVKVLVKSRQSSSQILSRWWPSSPSPFPASECFGRCSELSWTRSTAVPSGIFASSVGIFWVIWEEDKCQKWLVMFQWGNVIIYDVDISLTLLIHHQQQCWYIIVNNINISLSVILMYHHQNHSPDRHLGPGSLSTLSSLNWFLWPVDEYNAEHHDCWW